MCPMTQCTCRAQPMVVHAICHGTASPSYTELCRVTRQYANFLLLHGMVLNPEYERYSKMNLETGERDCVPPGKWQPWQLRHHM